jgi:NADP-dependent 3-hydroxy acid dehydrogenase YdfG
MIETMSDTIPGRVAAITGASSGIGAATARALASRGVAVALAARRQEQLERVCEEIRAGGGRAIAVVADVTSESDMRSFVTRALAAFGRLDVMVCNAGSGFYGTLEDTGAEVMTRLMAVNFMGSFHAARAALPYFEQQGFGHLIFVSSIVGRRGIPHSSAYSATKFAQVGLAEALRAEYLARRIHVTVVYPVSTDTEFREAVRRDYGILAEGRGPTQSAERVAEAIVGAVARPRPEVYPYRPSWWLAVLSVVAPGLTDRLVRRFARRHAEPGEGGGRGAAG